MENKASTASQIRAEVRRATRQACAEALLLHADSDGYDPAYDGLSKYLASGRNALATSTSHIVRGARIAICALWYARDAHPSHYPPGEAPGAARLWEYVALASAFGFLGQTPRDMPWAFRAALDEIESRAVVGSLSLAPAEGELADAVEAWAAISEHDRDVLEAVLLLCRVVGAP